VLVRKEGGVLSRVERPVPVAVEEGPNAKEGTGSRLFKAASNRFTGVKEKDSRDTSSVHSREDSGHGEEVEVIGRGENANEPFTDPDGWVFGDNKWENQSNKGGISKVSSSTLLNPSSVVWISALWIPYRAPLMRYQPSCDTD
jgi:hypothetical protein